MELSPNLQTLGICMLKIQRSANGRVIFTLSGRIEAEDVKELRQLLALETGRQRLVLDLRDVTLVNEGAVKFLAGCEADSVKLENCPAYIREWIERVKGRTRRRRTGRKDLKFQHG
jgi:anti-anti-sigma regulatory factor